MSVTVNKLHKEIQHLARGYNRSMSEQLQYLSRCKKPTDDYERSFLQYNCQRFLSPKTNNIILDILSWPALLVLPIVFLISSLKYKVTSKYDAVFIENGMNHSIIPNVLKKKYQLIVDGKINGDKCLNKEAFFFLLRVFWRHPLSPYYNVKLCIKIAVYCAYIMQYDPKAVISYCETSFASSLATNYLEKHSIQHINVQHGDFLKSILFTGFRFTAFYVWDEHYSNMFKRLWNDTTQYIVAVPESVSCACSIQPPIKEKVYLTYYLGNETPERLSAIAKELYQIQESGKKCEVRMHPRESNALEINYIFNGITIQNPHEVSLVDSLNDSEMVCALNSTVLFQAGFCGRTVVIDDITAPTEYRALFEQEYIMLNRPHKLLSELL